MGFEDQLGQAASLCWLALVLAVLDFRYVIIKQPVTISGVLC
jgi:hypothetical protein